MRWPRPTTSCAGSSTASSTWTTSRPTCCRCSDDDLALDRAHAWAMPTAARSCTNSTRTANSWRRSSTRCSAASNATAARCNGAGGAAPPRPGRPARRSCRRAFARAHGGLARAPARAGAARRRARPAARAGAAHRRTGCERRQRVDARPVEAALRWADWIEPLLRRESYLALLVERPAVHERLLRLLGAARWPARYLLQHPGVIDELASDADAGRAASRRPTSSASSKHRHASLQPHRRRRRGAPAQPAAPCAPRRGVPHAGARRRGPPHGRAGGRRPERAGRRGAARHRPLVLAARAPARTARRRSSRSSATASWAARSWATAATSTSCSSTTTTTSAPPRSTPPTCAS